MERSIGRLEGRMSALETQVLEIHGDTKAMRATLDRAKGGWKALVTVGAISGTLSALAVKFIPFVK